MHGSLRNANGISASPFRRQAQLPGTSHEKRSSEPVFQTLYAGGDIRLHGIQKRRSLGHIAVPRDGEKDGKIQEKKSVHVSSVFQMLRISTNRFF
jgi:hypothetical protein